MIAQFRLLLVLATVFIVIPFTLIAQQRDVVPLRAWPAPLYFQPSHAEEREHAKPEAKPDALNALSSDVSSSLAATPAGSLVFVAMTPCRIADTRDASFPIGFGPPTLTGNTTRIFDIQSPTSRCPVPSIAQAYSFNITVVPPGATFPGNVNPSGALGYLTIWPTGVTQPVVSTLNSFLGTVAANAAIVPAGTNGSVDVFVYNNTDVVIDINGYYASQSGITLAQGTAGAPSLSFRNDPGTGIFSSGAGTLNIATGGTNRLQVLSNGDTNVAGNFSVNGDENVGGRISSLSVGVGSTSPVSALDVRGSLTLDPGGSPTLFTSATSGEKNRYLNVINSPSTPSASGLKAGGILIADDYSYANPGKNNLIVKGSVEIGDSSITTNVQLDVEAANMAYAVFARGANYGVSGTSTNGLGVSGTSNTNYGVYGSSGTNYAGYFGGNVFVLGCLSASNLSCPSDARLKENITPLSYGLPEVLRLRPVTWQWKDATKTEPNMGLVAQEVEPVLPELILQNSDNKGALGLNYMGLIPVLIKGMQDQQAQIGAQQEQNRKLEERLVAVEKLLSTMQSSAAAQ